MTWLKTTICIYIFFVYTEANIITEEEMYKSLIIGMFLLASIAEAKTLDIYISKIAKFSLFYLPLSKLRYVSTAIMKNFN